MPHLIERDETHSLMATVDYVPRGDLYPTTVTILMGGAEVFREQFDRSEYWSEETARSYARTMLAQHVRTEAEAAKQSELPLGIPPRFSDTPDFVFSLDGDYYRVTARTVRGWHWLNERVADSSALTSDGNGLRVEQRSAYARIMKIATDAGFRVRVE
jgi:hypothetical protein